MKSLGELSVMGITPVPNRMDGQSPGEDSGLEELVVDAPDGYKLSVSRRINREMVEAGAREARTVWVNEEGQKVRETVKRSYYQHVKGSGRGYKHKRKGEGA